MRSLLFFALVLLVGCPAPSPTTPSAEVPDTAITAGPEGAHASRTATFEFAASIDGATFECKLDQGQRARCVSPITFSSLAEGAHRFEVRALKGDFVDDTPAVREFRVDAVTVPEPAPETSIVSGPPVWSSSPTAEFVFGASGGGISFECSVDGGPYVACTAPFRIEALAEGQHRFAVRAVNAQQVPDATPAERLFQVDLSDPQTVIDSGPTNATTSTPLSFSFASNESGASFQCAMDSSEFTGCESPKIYAPVAAGSHTFRVRAIDLAGRMDGSPATFELGVTDEAPSVATRVRVMAANITSGTQQSYENPGMRIFQGLDPDVVAIQEFNVGTNTAAELRAFVDAAFGTGFSYAREGDAANGSDSIPNGIISRWPILTSGEWRDGCLGGGQGDRDYAWARIDLPGPKDLWVVSLHLKASSGTTERATRACQANEIVAHVQANVPASDLLVLAGDFNTYSRTEVCLVGDATHDGFRTVADVAGPYPQDQNGDEDTNAGRSSPYDWVLADADLDALQVPTEIGASTYPNGLVFDSRVYTPLTEVAPVLDTDSGAAGMQHMAVVRDFLVPN